MSSQSSQPSNQELRASIRKARRAISIDEQARSSARICEKLSFSPVFMQSRHIAFFLAADGEIDLRKLLETAVAQGKHCYLPVSRTDGSFELLFYPYRPGDSLNKTSLGVLEPVRQDEARAAIDLDLVLTPLVAFDERCYRMGMGKGFYDRSFSFRLQKVSGEESERAGPEMVGVAHACQKVARLNTDWWDVPLDAVVTPDAQYGDTSLLNSGS